MTDNTDALDELVSRYLDNEATADEIARVESDPDLLARADAMRAAIEAVAAPVDIPTADLDRIRAAAIAASTTSAEVSDLAVARARRLERRNRFVAIAAAFVLLAVAFTAVQAIDGDDDDEADVATEASDGVATSDASSDEGDDSGAIEMFGDDDMAEEEMGDAATAELDEDMAADDDMADEAEGDRDDSADDGAIAESAPGVPLPDPRNGVDVLPDFLGGFDTTASIVGPIEEAYASVVDDPGSSARAEGSFAEGLCDDAVALVVDVLGDDIVSVEETIVELAGELVAVNVAVDLDGGLAIYVHPIGECPALQLISPELP